jgi:hypothetical protein
MSAILGIGCIIDRNELIEELEQCKFLEKYKNLIITKDHLRENINEVIYDDVNDFLKDNNLPFEFYTPYTQSKHDGKKYYLRYKFNKVQKDDVCESINFSVLMNQHQTINKHFEMALVLLFGDHNVDKFKLTIFSNLTY